jgi:transposase-like protein
MKKNLSPPCPDCGAHDARLDAVHVVKGLGQYTTRIYICQACNHTFLDEVKNALPA